LNVSRSAGKFDVLLTRKGAYTISPDFSLSELGIAREIFHSYESKEAYNRHMAPKHNCVDICYSDGAIERFGDKEQEHMLSEKSRVTRFRGCVIASFPHKSDVLNQIYEFLFTSPGRLRYGFFNFLSKFDPESLMRRVALESAERRGALKILLLFSLYFAFKHSALKRLCHSKADDPVALRLSKGYASPIFGFWLICEGMKE
jgi:hypothetical protein